MKRFMVCVLIAALALVAAPVMAQEGGEVTEVPALVDVLAMLAQGVGVGFVLAFLFEKPGWFAGLDSNIKWWVVFGASIGLPIAAQLLLAVVPAETWALIEPYWHSLAYGFLSWAGTQVAYKMLIKPYQAK